MTNPAPDARASKGVPHEDETLGLDHSPLMRQLETVLQETDFTWSVSLIGEDQATKLGILTSDLRRRFSTTGDGKRITSGFSYLGAEPAIAWTRACRDHLYPVMMQSIESFGRRWNSIRPALAGQPYHYVSLGPGDGRKDTVILQDLRHGDARSCYVAVDMSTEMLRLGVNPLIHQHKFPRSRILPVELDFSSRANVIELRRLLHGLFGDDAILFSLLGNTMANFENDTETLKVFIDELLRPQDRFMLEVATTRQLDDTMAQKAAEEYEHSSTFREFVTSALLHYTDLHIEMEGIHFLGSVEEERALQIKILYQNQAGEKIRITLPDRTTVLFPPQDTIRLYISRKYARGYLESLPAENGVCIVDSSHFDVRGSSRDDMQFGIDLLILKADLEIARQKQPQTLADYTWRTRKKIRCA